MSNAATNGIVTNGDTMSRRSGNENEAARRDLPAENMAVPTRVVDIVVGSHFRKQALKGNADEILIFETAEAALQHHSPRVRVVHMELDKTAELPPHVPTRGAAEAGRDGAALDSSHSLRIVLSKREKYRQIIERKIAGADLVRLYVSSGGGTGTGTEPVFREILRKANFGGRIIALHHYSTSVQPRKMTKAIKGLLHN
jgi:hypothetical protein